MPLPVGPYRLASTSACGQRQLFFHPENPIVVNQGEDASSRNRRPCLSLHPVGRLPHRAPWSSLRAWCRNGPRRRLRCKCCVAKIVQIVHFGATGEIHALCVCYGGETAISRPSGRGSTGTVTIRRQNRDVAVVISPTDYRRLTSINVEVFQRFCDRISTAAKARGMTEEKLDGMQNGLKPVRVVIDTNVWISRLLLADSAAARAVDNALTRSRSWSPKRPSKSWPACCRGRSSTGSLPARPRGVLRRLLQGLPWCPCYRRSPIAGTRKNNRFLALALDSESDCIVSGDATCSP